ncbi:MAG: hypothetical protein M3251_01820 [Thermoproteota archaeon]|nr:hypothetical protein [Thermoproteota archaeon]
MSERKRQAPLSEKEKQGEKREEEDDKDEASEQDMQIEVPDATNAIRSQENAIESVVKENTTTIPTTETNFHLITREEEDLMQVMHYMIWSSLQLKKPKSYLRKK